MTQHSSFSRGTFRKLFLTTLMAALLAGCTGGPSAEPSLQSAGDSADLIDRRHTAQTCPVPAGSPTLPDLADPLTWASDLEHYLNQGGLLTTLLESIESRQTELEPEQTGVVLDLNADGSEDLALILTDRDQNSTLPSGTLFLFLCGRDRYELEYISPPAEVPGLPSIAASEDLNADGFPDLLISTENCGAHTCFQNLQVLSYVQGRFENILQGRSDDLPNPTLELHGPGDDGRWSLAMTGTGISSAGAGPYRERTRTWTWNPTSGAYVPGQDALGEPRYRIHLLQEADATADAGDYATALERYQQVIEDSRFDDWIYGETGQRTLAAFATYRQMWIHLSQGDTGAARRSLEFMQASATNDTADMLELAQVTFEAYENGGIAAACTAAQAYGASHTTSILEPLNYGYANRAYSAPDLCLSSP